MSEAGAGDAFAELNVRGFLEDAARRAGDHVFGPAEWWGKDLFGIDNALVGDWPVVVIRDGKATIVEYRSIPAWWDKHKDLLIKHMSDLGQLWNQRS